MAQSDEELNGHTELLTLSPLPNHRLSVKASANSISFEKLGSSAVKKTKNLSRESFVSSSKSAFTTSSAESLNPDSEQILEVSPDGVFAKLNVILGKGSCKVVWKGINKEEGVEIAWNCVKTTKAEYSQISQEIEILKKVRHPNIITFHDSWYNSSGEFVFITELMPSGTLREYIKKFHPVSLKIMRKWCRQILKGLHYLHSHKPPIIHRDIKCDNIFINGSQGEAKIGDMGTAKMKFGQKYTVIGTPEFMAPEMYEDKGYNEKVDIYAFGMCLLEMATGEYPYLECKNAAQIYKKVSNGIKPECLKLVQDSTLYSLIEHCLVNEHERLGLNEILNHPFFNSEPEISLVSLDEEINKVTLQLSLRKIQPEKPPVKFDFFFDSDTADVVVQEMINENYLDVSYQSFVVSEINRIVRESRRYNFPNSSPTTSFLSAAVSNLSISKQSASTKSSPISTEEFLIKFDTSECSLSSSGNFNDSSSPTDVQNQATGSFVFSEVDVIEVFVAAAALDSRRNLTKATEWAKLLRSQDILCVGDLRQLHAEDWSSLKLTVFACRALKNLLAKSSFK